MNEEQCSIKDLILNSEGKIIRKPSVDSEFKKQRYIKAFNQYQNGIPVSVIVKELKCSRTSFYKHKKQIENLLKEQKEKSE